MNNFNNSSNKKGEDINNDQHKVKINLIDYNQDPNSVLLKDMISQFNNDKANSIINPQRNNIVMQKWALHDPLKNRNIQNKQQKNYERQEENSPPQKEKRLISTANSRIRDCKTISPLRIQDINVNQIYNLDPNTKICPINIVDNNKMLRNDNKPIINIYEIVKTKELQLDTKDRFQENLNKTNFFTERTNSLIEMNKKKKYKQEQKSKSPNTKNSDDIQIESETNKHDMNIQTNQETDQTKKGNQSSNSKFVKANYSNLLTNQKSSQHLIRIDLQNDESQLSKQCFKALMGFDYSQKYKWKQDENIRSSILNKSDNEIQVGNLYEQDKQNLSFSGIYNINQDKQNQPKRQIIQFPDNQLKQIPNLSHLRNNANKPFISGAQSHNSGQFHGFPHIKSGIKRINQITQKHLKQDAQINEGGNCKFLLTKLPLHQNVNKTLNSPNNQQTKNNTNSSYHAKVTTFTNETKDYITTEGNTVNNTINHQNISYQSQSNEELIQYCDISYIDQNNQNSENETEFINQLNNSSLLVDVQKNKSHSVNQLRKLDGNFIELNKKKLKYISMKKKTAYDQIVDSILKQHDIKEKDEKKKEKRKQFQQVFQQNTQYKNNQFTINNQYNSQTQRNLNTTIGSDIENCLKSGISSPDGRETKISFKDKTNEDFKFQPQGIANKNKYKKNETPYQQYLEKQIESETRRQNSNRFQKQNRNNSKSGIYANENLKQDDIVGIQSNTQYNISYSQQQQIQFKRRMKKMQHSGNRSRLNTIEDYINSEQLKQKLIQTQLQNNTTISDYYHNHSKNNSKLMNTSFLRNNATLDQIQMTQNTQRQANQIKKQIDNADHFGKIKKISKTEQNLMNIHRLNGEKLQNEQKNGKTISTIQIDDRVKDIKKSTDYLLSEEDLFAVNQKSRYMHDRNDPNTQMNYQASKKRIKSQNSVRNIHSNDNTEHLNKYKKSPTFKNEIQPWDTVDQNQFDDEGEDICAHLQS